MDAPMDWDGFPYIRQWDAMFIVAPKCGSSAIRQTLRRVLGAAYREVPYAHCIMAAEVVGVCRHPLTRLISCWRNKILPNKAHHLGKRFKDNMSWEDFVEAVCANPHSNIHFYPQYEWMCRSEDVQITHLMRFETLAVDWSLFFKSRGVEFDDLMEVNVTKAGTPFPAVRDEDNDLIYETYQQDYEALGYAKDIQLCGGGASVHIRHLRDTPLSTA